jgi:hypothetical protein
MTIFEIKPSSLPNGEFAAAWFDDEQQTWEDERLDKVGALASTWTSPRLKVFRAAERGVTDVLFNPNALAVSARVREDLCRFPELEFLPIAVEGSDAFFVLHVTAAVEVSVGFSVRRAPPPSGNIVELSEFPVGYVPPSAFFRVRQPADSAGGRAGFCVRTIYVSEEGAGALAATCGTYLTARALHNRVPS